MAHLLHPFSLLLFLCLLPKRFRMFFGTRAIHCSFMIRHLINGHTELHGYAHCERWNEHRSIWDSYETVPGCLRRGFEWSHLMSMFRRTCFRKASLHFEVFEVKAARLTRRTNTFDAICKVNNIDPKRSKMQRRLFDASWESLPERHKSWDASLDRSISMFQIETFSVQVFVHPEPSHMQGHSDACQP